MCALTVGSTLAGCRLEAIAGRGGMGVVYRATQLALDRPVAVKVIAPHFAQDAGFRERFQRESQLAASIDHPNVIPVYEAGERDEVLYLIMRWVQGTELRALLRREGRLAPDRAVSILRPVASALAAAHRRGLVHRDVKPANVLIAEGDGDEHVYLTDFGIARRIDTDAAMTRTGALVGTLDYVAPERIEGGRGDESADVYSLGCMAFETLTGAVPFAGPTELAKMHAHVHEPPPSARAMVPEVPVRLDAVVTRAMAKDPAARFPAASDMATALAGALGAADSARRARAEADTAETELPEPPEAASVEPTRVTRPLAAEEREPAAARPAPPRPGPARRFAWPFAAVGAALVAVVVVVVLLSRGSSPTPGGSATTTSTATTTPAPAPTATGSAQVGRTPAFHVGGGPPAGAVLSAGRLWVAVPATGRLLGLAAGRPAVTVGVGDRPDAVAADPQGRVWVSHTGARRVTVYDPGPGRSTPVRVGRNPGPIAIAAGAAWVADQGEFAVTRIDLRTLAARRIALPSPPTAVVSAYGRVWVGLRGGPVQVLDGDGAVDRVAGPAVPGRVVAGGPSSGVWLLSAATDGDATLTRVDPRREVADRAGGRRVYHKPPHPPAVSGAPADLVALGDAIWVAAGRRVTRFDTNGTGTATATVTFPSAVGSLAVEEGNVYAVLPAAGDVYRIAF